VHSDPWYLRREFWLLMIALVVPFGWVVALGRVALAQARARRGQRA
jgi:hypothetical protein